MSSHFSTDGIILNPVCTDPSINSMADMAQISAGCKLVKSGRVTGTGTLDFNLFKITGSVKIVDAYAEITSVTTLTNGTGAKFYLYDGTNSVDITATGAVLSNAPAGSIILKTGDATQIATVIFADQCRITESDASKKSHQPFICTQKNGADTFIKCTFDTTDAPVDFEISFYIVYIPLDGGIAEVV